VAAGRDHGPGGGAAGWAAVEPVLAAVAGAPEVGQRLGSVRRAVFAAAAAQWSRTGPDGWGPVPGTPPSWLAERLGHPRGLMAWWAGAPAEDRVALAVVATAAADLGTAPGQLRSAFEVDALLDAARRALIEVLDPGTASPGVVVPVGVEVMVAVLRRLAEWSDQVVDGLPEHADDQRRELAEVRLLQRFAGAGWTTGPALWVRAWQLLDELAARPAADRARPLPLMTAGVLLVLLQHLKEDLNADGPGYEFLAGPGWVAAVLGAAGVDLDRMAADWEHDSVRDKIIKGVAAVAFGAPRWMGRTARRWWTVTRLGGPVRWQVDPRFAPHRDLAAGVRDTAMAGADDLRQTQVLSAWLALVDSLARAPAPADALLAEQVPAVLGRLRAALPATPAPARAALIDAARTELRRTWVRWFAATRYGLDPDALPVPLESPAWDVAAGYEDVGHPVTAAVLAAHIPAGGGAAGIEAGERVWVGALAAAGEHERPLRLSAAPDRLVVVGPEPGVAGPGSEVVVGVARNQVGIMRSGHSPFDSCLDYEDGSHRELVQAHLLHPGSAMVHVLAPERRTALALIRVVRTRAGLLPLTNRVLTSSRRPFTPAVIDYLREWADELDTWLLLGTWQKALLPPDPGPVHRLKVVVPASPIGPTLWADSLDAKNALVLPHSRVLHVHRLRGPKR
jgi:hypothetical protein